MRSITTSIRLSNETRQRLESASHHLHHGMNWIINEALQFYLARIEKKLLTQKARQQSLLASKHTTSDEQAWEQQSDTSDWKI